MKNTLLLLTIILTTLLSGCASVQMESEVASNKAKEFNSPSEGMSGVYIYREDTHLGAALKKDVWIDGKCIGETAKGVYFYEEVEGNKEHKFSTESEFSPNDLVIKTAMGDLYFLKQYLKFGVFVGGAGLEQKTSDVGKKEMELLKMATKGQCSK